MLDGSHLHRQIKLLNQIEQRRKYRRWVQVFQVALLIFFSDQIFKTWSSKQLSLGEDRPLFGQKIIKVTHSTDSENTKINKYLPILFWTVILGWFLVRAQTAPFSELVIFILPLTGGLSNWVGKMVLGANISTLKIELSSSLSLSFNLADLMIVMGSFFLCRNLFRKVLAPWPRFSGQIG
jgi:lipoprotein signal peptidase